MLEMKNRRSVRRGFTLIELMVAVALIAIMLALAAPSLTTFQRNAELTTATNTLLSAINAARGEAMKRGRYAMVVPADTANWSSGWIVFVDMNRTQAFDSTIDIALMTKEAPPPYLTITGNNTATGTAPYIMFDASGYSKTKAGGFGALAFTIARNDVAASQLAEQTRRLIISSTGRARTCKPATDTTCVASSSQ